MFALGTSQGHLKIFNLKTYEQEIFKAHASSIEHILLVQNQGLLLSADSTGVFKCWDLKKMSPALTAKLP